MHAATKRIKTQIETLTCTSAQSWLGFNGTFSTMWLYFVFKKS